VSPLATLGAPCIATLADPTAQRTPFRLLPTCGLTMTAGGALCGQLAAGRVARLRGRAPTRPLRGPRASAA
jgi:hypothetical protein